MGSKHHRFLQSQHVQVICCLQDVAKYVGGEGVGEKRRVIANLLYTHTLYSTEIARGETIGLRIMKSLSAHRRLAFWQEIHIRLLAFSFSFSLSLQEAYLPCFCGSRCVFFDI